jgi:HK97 family phage portal protein
MIGRVLAGGLEDRGRVLGDDHDIDVLTEGGFVRRGVAANEKNAMLVPALFAAVRIISQSVAMTPLEVIHQAPDGTREAATTSRLWDLLGVTANREHNAGEVWEFVTASLLLRGNAYLWRERDGFGRVIGLWPMRPDLVQVRRDPQTNHKIFLLSSSSDDPVQYIGTTFDVLHIRGLGIDGLQGWSVLTHLADLLNRAHGESRYQLQLLRNGVRPSGVLTSPGKLSDDASKRMKARWQAAYGGIENTGGTPVLEEGLEWRSISLSAADAQLLQQRMFTRQEIAMAFQVPPRMLSADEGGGLRYSSAAMDATSFAQFTVSPWCSRITRALRHDAELPWTGDGTGAGSLFPKFDLDALSEADPTTRYQNYLLARRGGWMTKNDPRRREGMKSLEGGDALPPDPTPGAGDGSKES